MDIDTAVAALNGKEYGKEGSREFFEMMHEGGLVAVFGASDDLMEFRGAINDEVDAYNGGMVFLTSDGLLKPECENKNCPHERRLREMAATIVAIWCPDATMSWAYKTTIPHKTFDVMEDGEVYCRGIVFARDDVV